MPAIEKEAPRTFLVLEGHLEESYLWNSAGNYNEHADEQKKVDVATRFQSLLEAENCGGLHVDVGLP